MSYQNRLLTALIVLVVSLTFTVQTVSTVQAQSPEVDPDEWSFITTSNKLYLVTGSQEFVTEVDTSQLPVKYFLRAQTDGAGNIYLLSVASSDRNSSLANYDRQLSLYFTRTDLKKQLTAWFELSAKDLSLSSDSGIYDFNVYADRKLIILGENGEAFKGAEDASGNSYQFKPYKAVMAPKVAFGENDAVPTDLGLLVHLFMGSKLNDTKYLSHTIGGISFVQGVNFVSFYSYPNPRDPTLPNRNSLTAYSSNSLKNKVSAISLEQPIISLTPIGAYDYYAIWTEAKVLLIRGDMNSQDFFGNLTDITSALGVNGKIISVAGYKTGGISNRASDNVGRNATFYIATDNGKVTRAVINSPTEVSVKTLKLLVPTYKIGKVGSAGSQGSALAPTPADPKEVVPGQPGVAQSSTQQAQSQPTASAQLQPTASQAPASSSGWTPRLVFVAIAVIGTLVVLLIVLRLVIHKSKASTSIDPGTPGPSGTTSVSGSGDKGDNPFRSRHR